jgi:hypothetical protein
MKNLLLTSILLLSFLFSYSQSDKKYTVNNCDGYDNLFTFNYNNKIITIKTMFNNANYFYFNINDTLYKIERSKVNFTNMSVGVVDELKNYSNGEALVKFSSQSQIALILQILAPSLLFLKSDGGIYGTLGVSLVATIIHIDAFRHLKTFAKIDKAIEYPY